MSRTLTVPHDEAMNSYFACLPGLLYYLTPRCTESVLISCLISKASEKLDTDPGSSRVFRNFCIRRACPTNTPIFQLPRAVAGTTAAKP